MSEESKHLQSFAQEPIPKLIWKNFLPAVLAILVQVVYNITDRIFIGQFVGEKGLASLTLTFPIFSLLLAFGIAIGVGYTTVMSVALGKKDTLEARTALTQAISLIFIISLISMLIGIFFIEKLLFLCNTPAYLLSDAKDYIQPLLIGVFFMHSMNALNGALRAQGKPQIAMFISIFSGLTNVLFDYILMVPLQMGIFGASLATVMSMALASLLTYAILFLKKDTLKIIPYFLIPRFSKIMEIIKFGLPPFMMHSITGIIVYIFNFQIIHYAINKTDESFTLAALGTFQPLFMFNIFFIFAVVQAMMPIIGYNYGASHFHRTWETIKYCLKFGFVISSSFCVLALCFAPFILQAFGFHPQDPHFPQLILWFRLYVFGSFSIGPAVIGGQFFQAIKHMKTTLFLILTRQVFILMPFLFIFPFFLKTQGIFLSQSISDIISAFLTLFLLYRWHQKNVLPFKEEKKETDTKEESLSSEVL